MFEKNFTPSTPVGASAIVPDKISEQEALQTLVNMIKATPPQPDWCNADNHDFYNELNVGTLKRAAEKSGLNSCIDLDVAQPFWQNANHILEAGACYGRVIQGLHERGYINNITALERSKNRCADLKRNYPEVNVIHSDLRTFNNSNIYDTILWLWSGIADFTPAEQLASIQHLGSFLTPAGFMVIDSFDCTTKGVNTCFQHDNFYVVEMNQQTTRGYNPTEPEVQAYAAQSNLKLNDIIRYTAPNGVKRILYIITKT